MSVLELYKCELEKLCVLRFSACVTKHHLYFVSRSIIGWLSCEWKLGLISEYEFRVLGDYFIYLLKKEMELKKWN